MENRVSSNNNYLYFYTYTKELYWFVGNDVAKITSLPYFLPSHHSQRGWCHLSTLKGCLCLLLTPELLFVLRLISADPVETFPISMTFVQHNLLHFPSMQQPLKRVISYPHMMTHGSFTAGHPLPRLHHLYMPTAKWQKFSFVLKWWFEELFDSILSQNLDHWYLNRNDLLLLCF